MIRIMLVAHFHYVLKYGAIFAFVCWLLLLDGSCIRFAYNGILVKFTFMSHLLALILHSFNAFIRLAGMPRRIQIILMNLKPYNAIETFGSVYHQ